MDHQNNTCCEACGSDLQTDVGLEKAARTLRASRKAYQYKLRTSSLEIKEIREHLSRIDQQLDLLYTAK